LAICKVIDYASLIDESFVLYSNDFSLNDKIIDRCRQAGFIPKVIFETLQLEIMTQLVADNFGITLLPSKVCQQLDCNTLVSLPMTNPQVYLKLGMAWKKDRYISHVTKEWLKFVKNNMAFNDNDLDITRYQWFWDQAEPS
jgi:DNA-binding transcriptional LysR family regulator